MKIEIDKLLEKRMEEILQGTAEIVAETSVGYFQDTFRHKAFDGNPWAPPRVPKQSGSLLVQSGALLNSIRPVVVTPGRIVIAAGNEKVDYARVHNEGFKGAVAVPAHIRHRSGEILPFLQMEDPAGSVRQSGSFDTLKQIFLHHKKIPHSYTS